MNFDHPELNGSEAQVRWANALREQRVQMFNCAMKTIDAKIDAAKGYAHRDRLKVERAEMIVLMKEIMKNTKARDWIDARPGSGVSFHVNIPTLNGRDRIREVERRTVNYALEFIRR